MSLRPDDRKGRSRSKSPAAKGRDRSSSNVRAPSPGFAQPYPITDVRSPSHAAYATPSNMMSGALVNDPRNSSQQQWAYAQNPGLANQQQPQPSRTVNYGSATGNSGGIQYATAPTSITYTAKPVVPNQPPPMVPHSKQSVEQQRQQYQKQQQFQKQQQNKSPYPTHDQFFPPPPLGGPPHSPGLNHGHPPGAFPQDNVVEVMPGGGRMGPPSPSLRPHSNSLGARHGGPELRAPSPGLGPRMDRLSVSGNRPNLQTISPGLPPPSPLLEAYHGTYQSISPMPSPMMHAYHPDDSDLEDFAPLSPRYPSGSQGHHRTYSAASYDRDDSPPSRVSKPSKSKSTKSRKDKSRDDRSDNRRVKIYDATADSLSIIDAFSHRTVDNGALIDIIPRLNHDQILELRTEYKRHCKVQGYGINVAKHIKMKTSGNFGKLAYVTALGRWESEGYWANTWYQSGNARRELLIEALMGRSNTEMREIIDAFRDKRYGDDLVKCMEKELKADKFRKAVLMALERPRQDERETYPTEYLNRDVDMLYSALKAREGGESAILEIVILRSDNHLRECLRLYEHRYRANFARDALKKSNNLVGEVIAHILNGVINRPARDAMLLHHALEDLRDRDPRNSKHERQQRYELLISRIVRVHWDRMHLVRVKDEFDKKYGVPIEHALEDSLREDFLEFCLGLVD